MSDQAEKLRNLVGKKKGKILLFSGLKGGVGKTTLVSNLSYGLRWEKFRTCMVDLNIPFPSLTISFGKKPKWQWKQIINDEISLLEALQMTSLGVPLLSGASSSEPFAPSWAELPLIMEKLSLLKEHFDYVLVDAPVFWEPNESSLCTWGDVMVLVATPEPASLISTYTLLKRSMGRLPAYSLIINRCQSKRQEREIQDAICKAAEEMMGLEIQFYGGIPEDYKVFEASCRRSLLLVEFPKTAASKAIRRICQKLPQEKGFEEKGLFSLVKKII